MSFYDNFLHFCVTDGTCGNVAGYLVQSASGITWLFIQKTAQLYEIPGKWSPLERPGKFF